MGKKVFISYRRADPDETVARFLEQALSAVGLDVFRDVNTPIGTRWAQEIQTQLATCDYFIILISEQSMDRDMVRQEIQQAYALSREKQKPAILPVRLAYRGALPYDMAAWLDPIQYAWWGSAADNDRLAHELTCAINGRFTLPHQHTRSAPDQQALLAATEAQGRPLPKAEPVMDVIALTAGNPFYVERDVDRDFYGCLAWDNGVATLHAPRQMGKSSLFNRVRANLENEGRKSVFLDLKLLATEPIADAREAFLMLAYLIVEQLGAAQDPESFFTPRFGAAIRFQRFLEQVVGVLPQRPVLLFDDVDAVFEKPYSDALFGGLRYIIDQKPGSPPLQNIGFGFAHSHDPAYWIRDSKQSPFNVARTFTVPEFNSGELDWLHRAHGDCVPSAEFAKLNTLLGGHPYLTRMALYCLAQGEKDFAQIAREAATDDGLFGDHLRGRLLSVVHAGLDKPFKRILDTGRCDGIVEFQALLAMGLVKGQSHAQAQARFDLYRDYFQPRLDA
jgi:hypothetical protein